MPFLYVSPAQLNQAMALLGQIPGIAATQVKIMSDIDSLKTAEAAMATAVSDAVAKIKALSDQITSLLAGNNPDVAAAAAQISQEAAALEAAVNPPAPAPAPAA